MWSVSKDSPILNIKVKETGFHSISVIPESRSTTNASLPSSNSNYVASSTSLSTGKSSSSSQSSLYQIPPAHVVCTFLDGGIGLYDIGKERWDFLRDYVSRIIFAASLLQIRYLTRNGKEIRMQKGRRLSTLRPF